MHAKRGDAGATSDHSTPDNVVALRDRRRLFFTVEMERALRTHLSCVIEGETLNHAMVTLDLECDIASRGTTALSRRKFWRELDQDLDRFVRAIDAVEAMMHRPNVGAAFATVDEMADLFECITRVRKNTESARAYADVQLASRGRPRKLWRDNLVHRVYSIYPKGSAAKSHGSHFEETVGLLLGYLKREVDDVHSAVMDALSRPHDEEAF